MKIAGIIKQSFVDYPGSIAAAVFTRGCNMNCVFCHNRHILGSEGQKNNIDEERVLNFLEKRKGLLDGVVISGGEPALQPDLEVFIQKVKYMGYAVKLDTNGTFPDIVMKLVKKGLLDYIAMDVKAPLEKYGEICRCSIERKRISESISVIMNSGIDYEFRTTCCPQLDNDDLIEIGKLVYGAKKYVLQQCRKTDENGRFTGYDAAGGFQSNTLRDRLRSCVDVFEVRGGSGVKAVS
ncbi:MAG TPA: anaerobic ribonucleoside-triphosphate reductase activating protein [Clostridia bacterium]